MVHLVHTFKQKSKIKNTFTIHLFKFLTKTVVKFLKENTKKIKEKVRT